METNKKQSAVSWLINQLHAKEAGLIRTTYNSIFDQARLMEKEQHGTTWDNAIQAHEDRGHVISMSITDFDEYWKSNLKFKIENDYDVKKLNINKIISIACKTFDIPRHLIISKTRKREVVQVRQLIAYIAKQNLDVSLSFIGRKLGGRDHSTIINSIKTIKDFLDTKDHITLTNLSLFYQELKRYEAHEEEEN